MSDPVAILRWYVALTFVAACLLPLVAWLGAGLGPARYGLTRPLALAVATALVWWPAIVVRLPFARWSLAVVVALAGVVGWALWWRHGRPAIDWRSIVGFEALWLAAFLLYAWFRGYHPDIAFTEKPMEIALLSSIARSTHVPAPDPWLAGMHINYYYFGYQSLATLIKLSGVPPAIAFNLGLATLFASCASVAAAIGVALTRLATRRRLAALSAAALAPVFLLLAGNLETARRLARHARATIDAGWWDGIGWQASRIIIDHNVQGVAGPAGVKETINEFPAFSFVLGDVHPHVLTYPLLAVVVALALGVVIGAQQRDWRRLAVIGALVGLLYASNSWDAPLGFALVVGAIGLACGFEWRTWLRGGLALAGGAIIAAAPFVLTFDPPVGVDTGDVPGWLLSVPIIGTLVKTFGIVTWRPTSLRGLLIVHGVWLAVFLVFASTVTLSDPRWLRSVRARGDALLVAGLLSIALAVVWAPAVVVIGWPLALALWIALRHERSEVRLIASLFAFAFLLVLIPEFIYIQDVFGDRMNTVFKLYFQAWLLFSVASAAALALVAVRLRPSLRALTAVGTLALLALTLPYVALSAQDWSGDFAQRQSLDGAAFIRRYAPGDAEAIAWLRQHANDGDTIVESPGCSYENYASVPMDRISAFTGLPTVIGWVGHEGQWRRGQIDNINVWLDARSAAANAILNGAATSGPAGAPRFLILGQQERTVDPNCSLTVPRPDAAQPLQAAGWAPAFHGAGTDIYVRAGDALAKR